MTILTPEFVQDGSYPASHLRIRDRFSEAPGIVGGGLVVTPATGLQVSVSSGCAYVTQTVQNEGNAFYNGRYFVMNDAASSPYNTIAAPLSNPRIDQVILRIYDVTEQGLTGSSFARLEWLVGAETSGANLTNLNGAAALPDNSLRLAYVLQTVGEGSIPGGNIRDARVNGGITTSQISPTAGILGSQLSPTAGITEGQLASVIGLNKRGVSTDVAAVSGDLILVTSGTPLIVALPSASPADSIVGISVPYASASGASAVAVGSVGGDTIFGPGLNAATAFSLGAPGAFILLHSDGGNWFVVAGQQDTGWINLTLQNGATSAGGSPPNPQYRLWGNHVALRGYVNPNGTSNTFTTLPAAARPTGGGLFAADQIGSYGSVSLDTSGHCQVYGGSNQVTNLSGVRFEVD